MNEHLNVIDLNESMDSANYRSLLLDILRLRPLFLDGARGYLDLVGWRFTMNRPHSTQA